MNNKLTLYFRVCGFPITVHSHNFNGHPQAETKDIDTISQVTTQQLASLNPLKASTCKFFA